MQDGAHDSLVDVTEGNDISCVVALSESSCDLESWFISSSVMGNRKSLFTDKRNTEDHMNAVKAAS